MRGDTLDSAKKVVTARKASEASSEGTPVRIEVWARPGGSRESVTWDGWRHRWVIAVTAPAVGGRANDAILALLTLRLSLPPARIRWVHSGTSKAKVAEVAGLTEEEIRRRLSRNDASNSARGTTTLEV